MARGEFALIDRYFRAVGALRGDVVLGVGDDGAILRPPPDHDLVAVSDTLVEDVHFPRGAAPRSIGHRALAVNLSDIAAMGATPAWSLLSLTLPAAEDDWLAEFATGYASLARAHDVALVGGDTTRGPLVVGVQVLGFLPRGRGLRRAGARPGDRIFVSGTPGDAAAGLELLQARLSASAAPEQAAELRERFEFPVPRVALGRALLMIASACIDISDGLQGDLAKLATASGCAAHLELERLPISAALAAIHDAEAATRSALTGGDDYELLFTVPPAHWPAIEALRGTVGMPRIAEIGVLREGEGVVLTRDGCPVPQAHAGFDHFA